MSNQCSICLERPGKPLECKHYFCGKCIEIQYFLHDIRCPMCRSPMSIKLRQGTKQRLARYIRKLNIGTTSDDDINAIIDMNRHLRDTLKGIISIDEITNKYSIVRANMVEVRPTIPATTQDLAEVLSEVKLMIEADYIDKDPRTVATIALNMLVHRGLIPQFRLYQIATGMA